MTHTHREPYLYLADVTHEGALIAWGAFYFSVHEGPGGWELVDDERLPSRQESIGERSEPYGDARVRVYDEADKLVAETETRDKNHVHVGGLSPDCRYRYEVWVEGERWADGERNDWTLDAATGHELLRPSGKRYDNTFRTHPAPDQPAALSFVLLGDYGVGIRGTSDSARRQREVGAALERAVEQCSARLMVTAGDNVYLPSGPEGDQGSGDEDDDWFFTFYQPYRYIINRIPVYPTVGNHDSQETERSDDREQLEDNFFLQERFGKAAERSSDAPGLYYRVPFGSDIELISIDTSQAPPGQPYENYFELPAHRAFLEQAFAPASKARPGRRWRIPFSHHPPYCAGPHHGNHPALISELVPLFEAAGVRAVFSGHEHNFQYSVARGVHYFVSGAGAKLRPDPPTRCEAAHTRAWAAEPHFLLVQIRGDEMRVTPIAGARGDRLTPITLQTTGAEVPIPIIIRR